MKTIRIIFEWLFLFVCPLFLGAILAFLSPWIWIIYSCVWILVWNEGKIFKHIP